jgi:hypothetical protein
VAFQEFYVFLLIKSPHEGEFASAKVDIFRMNICWTWFTELNVKEIKYSARGSWLISVMNEFRFDRPRTGASEEPDPASRI